MLRKGGFFGNEGMTLTELMVAMGVSSIVGLTAAAAMIELARTQASLDVIITRDSILQELRVGASSKKILERSKDRPQNIRLKECLDPADGVNCQGFQEFPVKLYDAPSTATGALPISGNESEPQRYTVRGVRCSPELALNADRCPIQVSTFFRAQCKVDPNVSFLPPNTCAAIPDFIEVFYKIEQVPGAKLGEAELGLLQKIEGSIVVPL
jgi:prepilin-type N-terminal cleavage/methylation domain-containing protein